MKIPNLLTASALSVILASCASQNADQYDTTGAYGADDYGTPDGVAYQPIEPLDPVYDSPAAYEDTAPPAPVTRPSAPAASSSVHTVVKGDTLWGLSRKYNVTIDAIKKANSMTRDTVVLGQKLVIPAR